MAVVLPTRTKDLYKFKDGKFYCKRLVCLSKHGKKRVGENSLVEHYHKTHLKVKVAAFELKEFADEQLKEYADVKASSDCCNS